MADVNLVSESSIYTVGGTVQAGSGLYIPREADEQLLELCRKRAYAYVLTTRQVGKSSLMVRTAEQLAREDVQVSIVDLTALGVNVTSDQWYQGLLTLIGDSLSLQTNPVEWWLTHAEIGPAQRLILFFETVVLVEVDGPIVIFVDEIDTTRAMTFTDDFYAAVRFMWNDRALRPAFARLSFVLVGVATPHDLIQDPVRTPFNVGTRVDLTDWTYEEALPLAQGLGTDQAKSRQVLRWILDWTNGHPYMTQCLCAAIVEQGQSDSSADDVAEVVAATFFGSDSDLDTNLQFVHDMLTWRAPDKEAVLKFYRDIRHEETPVRDDVTHQDALSQNAAVRNKDKSLIKAHLKLAGIVRREDGRLRVRNRIYYEVFDEKWIKEEMPINWQRRAYRASAAAVLLLLCITLPTAIYAMRKRSEAITERNVALNRAKELESALRKVEEQKLIAVKERDRAEKQTEIATQRERAAIKAEAAESASTAIAVAERHRAEQQTQLAKASEAKAVKAGNAANASAAKALEALSIAKVQTTLAEQKTAALQQAIENDRQNRVVLSLYQRKDWPDALVEFDKLHTGYTELYKTTKLKEHHELATWALANMGAVEREIGGEQNLLKARNHYLEALRIQEQTLPKDDPDLFASYNNLGHIYHDLKDYESARSSYEQALAFRKDTLKGDNPAIAESLENLAHSHRALARSGKDFVVNLVKAEELYNQALTIRKNNPQRPQYISALNNLAQFYRESHLYDMAEKTYKEVIAIQESTLEPEALELADSYNNLAQVNQDVSQSLSSEGTAQSLPREKAEAITVRRNVSLNLAALARQIRNGANTPVRSEVADASRLSNLAFYYGRVKNYDQAEKLHLRVLALLEKVAKTGETNSINYLAAALDRLGNFYQDESNPKFNPSQAMDYYKKSLELREKMPENSNYLISTSLNYLGSSYASLNRLEEAEQHFKRAITILKGGNIETRSERINQLGKFYLNHQKYAEAEALYVEALTQSEKELSATKRDSIAYIKGFNDYMELVEKLTNIYIAQNKITETGALYNRLTSTHEPSFTETPRDDPSSDLLKNQISCLKNLVALLEKYSEIFRSHNSTSKAAKSAERLKDKREKLSALEQKQNPTPVQSPSPTPH